jgi:nicotinamide mononucleotide transporter
MEPGGFRPRGVGGTVDMSVAEALGVAFGIAGVWLTIRQRIWCWPVGLVNVTLFAFVFFHARLYGAAALQFVYVVLSVYGWYRWQHPGPDQPALPVSWMPRRWWIGLGIAGSAFAAGLGVFLQYRTDAALPLLDAATTSFSLVAQWMTTRKWIDNWLLWIVVDVVYVAMYLSQRLYPTAGLYAVFLVLATLGFREWHRSIGRQEGLIS